MMLAPKSKTIEKGAAVLIVLEDPLPLDPSDDEVLDPTRIIDSRLPGHEYTLSTFDPFRQLIILWTSPFIPSP